MRITLDALETLDAIARHGSFGAAARALHKAQSAVSYSVRQLEETLGVDLFDRSSYRARLTPEGAAVLEEGRAVLSRARRLESMALEYAGGWEPRLRVVVDGVLPMRPIMQALLTLEDEKVPTHVQVSTEFLSGVERRFERDGAEIMIAKDWTRDPLLEGRELPAEALVLVAAAGHPVLTAGPHDLDSLRPFLEVSVHDSSEHTQSRDTNTVPGGRVFYVSDFQTKHDALRLGLGYGWLPTRLTGPDLASGHLVEVPHRVSSRQSLTPWLVTRRTEPLGRTARRFVEVVVAAWTA
ncbi:MAG: LysR family transcriptional regulator [Myxococcales bacterium]|nr:LysR family transcriptional regulator [Myxococcales bacterium]